MIKKLEKKMKYISIIITISLLLNAIFTGLTIIINVRGSSEDIFYNLSNTTTENVVCNDYFFNCPTLGKINLENEMYDTVFMKGTSCGGQVGSPSLPKKLVRILLPAGNEIHDIKISNEKKVRIKGTYHVCPIEESIQLGQKSPDHLSWCNETIYNSVQKFPVSLYTLIGTHYFRGYQIAIIALHPVQYIPLKGELFYFEHMKVTIEFKKIEGKKRLSDQELVNAVLKRHPNWNKTKLEKILRELD